MKTQPQMNSSQIKNQIKIKLKKLTLLRIRVARQVLKTMSYRSQLNAKPT